MKLFRILLILVVLHFSAWGQVEVLTFIPDFSYDSLSNSSLSLKFPLYRSKDPVIARRMNEVEYSSYSPVPSSPADYIMTLDSIRGLVDYSYRVRRNDSIIVSVELKGMTCGASCWPQREIHNFDAQTGRLIKIQDVLTADGIRELEKRFTPYFVNLIYQQGASGDPESDYLSNRKDCPVSDLFLITDDKIWFYERSPEKGGDDLAIAYCFSALKPFLSNDGRRILLQEKNCTGQPSNLLQKIFRGTIGKSRIVFYLDQFSEESQKCFGSYYYEQYGKEIHFQGLLADSVLSISTKGLNSPNVIDQDEIITVKITENGLVGTWSDGNKNLSVTLN